MTATAHDGGTLRSAGKVGTGFDADEMVRLTERMKPLEVPAATVAAPRAAVRGAHWLKPLLVAEIAYTEMTGRRGGGRDAGDGALIREWAMRRVRLPACACRSRRRNPRWRRWTC